jgi:hypothetical protein
MVVAPEQGHLSRARAGAVSATSRAASTLARVDYVPDDRSTPQLLRDWGAVMRELCARKVIRTNNNPVGDIAEAIVAEHYGGERGTFAKQAGTSRRRKASGSRSRRCARPQAKHVGT